SDSSLPCVIARSPMKAKSTALKSLTARVSVVVRPEPTTTPNEQAERKAAIKTSKVVIVRLRWMFISLLLNGLGRLPHCLYISYSPGGRLLPLSNARIATLPTGQVAPAVRRGSCRCTSTNHVPAQEAPSRRCPL